MSAKWYPEGYSYPTMPTYSEATDSSGTSGQVSNSRAGIRVSSSRGYCLSPGRSSPTKRSIAHGRGLVSQELDLVDGVNYFKIGEMVHIRRYHAQQDKYSSWLPGTVVRPVFKSGENGTSHRLYIVSYVDPYTQEVREKSFAPHLKEIADIPSDDLVRPAAPQFNPKPPTVFAFIYSSVKQTYVWTPALFLSRSMTGSRVRMLVGSSANREVDGVKFTMPYTSASLAEIKGKGQDVETGKL